MEIITNESSENTLTLRLIEFTKEPFAYSVDQDQTASCVQSRSRSAKSRVFLLSVSHFHLPVLSRLKKSPYQSSKNIKYPGAIQG